MFKKAKRNQSKLRLALIGPSGSGKTYSALLIAKGLGGSIAMIDTERGSGNLYSDLADYDIAELEPPFTPEKYVEAIQQAEQAGYDTIIIDSLSHAWSGPGGVLEFVDKASQNQKNNFAAWREASPKHHNLVDALIQSRAHVVGTMRSKTQWEVQRDERSGKTKPVKIGLAPVQREGLEYEFTVVLEVSVDGHVASASKDRTSLFDGQYFVPSTETGEALKAWLAGASGNGDGNGQHVSTDPAPKTQPEPKVQARVTPMSSGPQIKTAGENMAELQVADLLNIIRELGLSDYIEAYESYLVGKYGHGLRGLDSAQIQEQFDNLSRCKEDGELFHKFITYLDGLKARKTA